MRVAGGSGEPAAECSGNSEQAQGGWQCRGRSCECWPAARGLSLGSPAGGHSSVSMHQVKRGLSLAIAA